MSYDSEGLQPVGNYGIHAAHGMAFLHQREDGSGNDVASNIASPFVVDLNGKKWKSPHRFIFPAPDVAILSELKMAPLLEKNPLLAAMVPKVTPSPLVGFVAVDQPYHSFHVFQRLAELSCPIHDSAVRLFTKGDENRMVREYRLTNLQPVVLIGFDSENCGAMYRVGQAAHTGTRNVIFVGTRDVPVPQGMTPLTDSYEEAKRFADINYTVNFREVGSALMVKEAADYALRVG
jgi:hypothetical protein